MDIATFLGGSSIIAVILIGLLKKWIKDTIEPRFGDLGIQLVLLAIAFALVGIGYGWMNISKPVLTLVGQIFASAMVIYQVLIKAIWTKVIKGNLDKDEQ